MSKKSKRDPILTHGVMAIRREQALCISALQSSAYDEMTDEEWVSLCEQAGKESAENPGSGKGQRTRLISD